VSEQSVAFIHQRYADDCLLWAMHDYHMRVGWWPTLENLRQHLGWKSTSTVWEGIQRLRRQGLVAGHRALAEAGWRAGARTAHPARTVAFVTVGGVRSIGIAEPVEPWPPEIVRVWT